MTLPPTLEERVKALETWRAEDADPKLAQARTAIIALRDRTGALETFRERLLAVWRRLRESRRLPSVDGDEPEVELAEPLDEDEHEALRWVAQERKKIRRGRR